MDLIVSGYMNLITPMNVLLMFIGVSVGILFGAMPGLTSCIAIALKKAFPVADVTAVDVSAEAIRSKYPKVAALLQRRGESDLMFTMILRIIKVIPVEALSIYLSATGTRYLPFLLGSVLGMLPSCVLFPIMGTNVGDIHSPEFLTKTLLRRWITTSRITTTDVRLSLRATARVRPSTALC